MPPDSAATGICHTFLDNTSDEVRLLVIAEKPKPENLIHYPLNPVYATTRTDRWVNPPQRKLGPRRPGNPAT